MSNRRAPRRIFLVGFYGIGNLGDEEIRRAIASAATTLGLEIAWFSVRRPTTNPRARRLRSRSFLGYLAAIIRADEVVLGGGGILKDEGLGGPIELLLTVLLARLTRTPVSLLSVGVGPFYSRLGRILIGLTARLCGPRVVRDADSAAQLRSLGIDNVTVGADPIFTRVHEVAPPRTHVGRSVIISARPWFQMEADGAERRRRLAGTIAEACDVAAAAGWSLRGVALYWPRDSEPLREVQQDMRDRAALLIDTTPVRWSELEKAVGSAGLVVAMRYHAVACAAMAGAPVIAIAYEPKVRALAEELGLAMVDPGDERSLSRLPELVADALRDPDRYSPSVDALAALRDRAWAGLRIALNPADGGPGAAG